MREFTALMRAVEALGEAEAAEAALPHGAGAALVDPLRTAIKVRAAAAHKLTHAARSYYRAKVRRATIEALK